MQKLDSKNQFPGTADNVTQVLGEYGISHFTFEPIMEGIANSSFVITTKDKKYVLRVYAHGRQRDEDIHLEIQFQDYLRPHDIPVPFIYPNKEGSELSIAEIAGKRWQAILMEYIQGKSVTTRPSKALIAHLAHLQSKMHVLGERFAEGIKRPKKKWEDLHDTLAERLGPIPVESQEVSDLIERVKAYRYALSSDLPHGYNHRDIDFDGNVLTEGDTVKGIVDFEDLEYSPSVACLGFTLWNILDDEGEEAMRYYLAEYEKVRRLASLEKETLPHIIFYRNYIMAVTRLMLWDKDTPIEDIEDILKLEQSILNLTF